MKKAASKVAKPKPEPAKAPPPKKSPPKMANAASKLMEAAKSRAEKVRKAGNATERDQPRQSAPSRKPPSLQRSRRRKEPAKPAAPRANFKAKEYVVYPAHGVGQILEIEEKEVAGHRLELTSSSTPTKRK